MTKVMTMVMICRHLKIVKKKLFSGITDVFPQGAETQRGHSYNPLTQLKIPVFIYASPKF
jgi:hypothetical protein